jgi:hypothetical protein
MDKQLEIVKTMVPKIVDEIITLNLPDCYTMAIQKIRVEYLGNNETALEYTILDPCNSVVSRKNVPEMVDDACEDILRAASNSMNILKFDNGLMVYQAGSVGRDLEKRCNVYKSKNAWARGF